MSEINWIWLIVSAVVGYFVGNIETAVILSKLKYHDDVRQHGSGNAGTTNMLRVFGMKPGIFTFLGDFLKGIVAVLLGRIIAGEIGGYLCGLCAVIGHDFPALFGFKGGKGVATTLAIAWMLSPLYAAIATVISFAIIYLTQMVSVGALIGVTLYMIVLALTNLDSVPLVILCITLWLLVIFRHKDNIKRIFAGTESRLFKHK